MASSIIYPDHGITTLPSLTTKTETQSQITAASFTSSSQTINHQLTNQPGQSIQLPKPHFCITNHLQPILTASNPVHHFNLPCSAVEAKSTFPLPPCRDATTPVRSALPPSIHCPAYRQRRRNLSVQASLSHLTCIVVDLHAAQLCIQATSSAKERKKKSTSQIGNQRRKRED
ncbi:hypothetical protein M0R45_025902 [Rubus argutus]|uniref:Uncharacterized protein n=1 Tax=Rubus argutus TaxID=59490 RepID=A0AAW1WWM4_RUBAR